MYRQEDLERNQNSSDALDSIMLDLLGARGGRVSSERDQVLKRDPLQETVRNPLQRLSLKP